MSQDEITLISFGHLGKDITERVAGDVFLEFHQPVSIREGHLDLSEFFDSTRNQYNGNLLIKHVDSLIFPNAVKVLGLFDVDLFIPILTYIFGQAFLGGKAGVVSVYRLKNERYGMNSDNELMIERLRKEVIHELGHTFGLIHCQNPDCVMRSSTYVEDIDQKSHHLCGDCRLHLKQ